MKHFENCRSFTTGLSDPHTIQLDARLVSIVPRSAIPYYIEKDNFQHIATATDTRGYNYDIFSGPSGIVAARS